MPSHSPEQYVETGVVRLVFQNLTTPEAAEDAGGKPKYSACILIPKDSTVTIERLKTAYGKAAALGKNIHGSMYKAPKFEDALQDGDAKDAEVLEKFPCFKGMYALNPHSYFAPKLVDRNGDDLKEAQEALYDGCYVRVKMLAAPFVLRDKTKKGVTWYLQAVQKVRDGERLGAEQDAGFTPLTEEDAQDEESIPFF